MYSNAIESSESAVPTSPDSLDKIELEKIEKLSSDLKADSLKKQLAAVLKLATLQTLAADQVLIEFVQQYGQIASDSVLTSEQPGAACGSAYQHLYRSTSEAAKAFIAAVPEGILNVASGRGVDYSDLQRLLVAKEYQAADKLTTEKMCAIAGADALKRKWVYFTEVSQFPNADILTIDALWRTYSEDKFGWSQQRSLWLRLGQDWERLWPQIAWQSSAGAWTRYPTEFVWDLDAAPVGHLPLFNQLRGVRVMSALLSHPAWTQSESGDGLNV